MKTKQLKQDILNHEESIGFPRLNAATETRTNLTFYMVGEQKAVVRCN